jgi:hypothetical protein
MTKLRPSDARPPVFSVVISSDDAVGKARAPKEFDRHLPCEHLRCRRSPRQSDRDELYSRSPPAVWKPRARGIRGNWRKLANEKLTNSPTRGDIRQNETARRGTRKNSPTPPLRNPRFREATAWLLTQHPPPLLSDVRPSLEAIYLEALEAALVAMFCGAGSGYSETRCGQAERRHQRQLTRFHV